jgi:putative membrane protein
VSPRARQGLDRYHLGLGALFLTVWIWAAIDPVHRDDWWLENLLVFAGVPLFAWLGPRARFSRLSWALITLFMILHVIGSHYTYAETPLGFAIQGWLGLARNPYDRIVHFLFGLLLALPMREMFVNLAGVRGGWSFYLPVAQTLACSAFYETLEWAATEVVASEAGIAFLGAQGDVWDAQKDTALALLGAVVAMVVARLARGRDDGVAPVLPG